MPEIEIVPDHHGGSMVVMDGQMQSYVHPDPTRLEFEYMVAMGIVIDALPDGPLAVTHVGGGGLTIPRYLAHTRPGSPQIVLEPCTELTEAVRRELPLPRGHRIRVRGTDGLRGVAALKDASADLVIVDAYAEGRVPAELTTSEFMADVRRVLRPDGIAMWNLADRTDWRWAARVGATAQRVFGPVAVMGTSDVIKKRRFGNTVLIAPVADLDLPAVLRAAAGSPLRISVRHGRRLTEMLRFTVPLSAADPMPSPPADPSSRFRFG